MSDKDELIEIFMVNHFINFLEKIEHDLKDSKCACSDHVRETLKHELERLNNLKTNYLLYIDSFD